MTEKQEFFSRVRKVAQGIEGLTETNLQKMEQRGYVPSKHYAKLIEEAPRFGVSFTLQELSRTYQ